MNTSTALNNEDLLGQGYRGDYIPLKRRGRGDYRIYLLILRRSLFIIATILLLYVTFKSNLRNDSWQELPKDVVSTEDLSISVRNARYAGLDTGKLPFSITADEVIQDKANPNELRMVSPKADILLDNGEWVYMSAGQSIIESNSNRMLMSDGVDINFSKGYELSTNDARMNMRLGIILGDSAVRAQGVNFAFTSEGFRIHNSGQNIALLGATSLTMNDITVSARTALEWHRKEHHYEAEGKVRVKNGDINLSSEKLEVFYENVNIEEGEKQVPKIIKAYDGVEVRTSGSMIRSQIATYDLPRKLIKFFGSSVELTSQDAKLDAKQSLEYWTDSEIAIARGEARVQVQGGKILSADTIRAKISFLDGKKQVSSATAEKNVRIDTGKAQIFGDSGRYDFTTQQGKICGNLRIIEEGKTLKGECATIDMRTGTSHIENKNSDTDGRVHGSFGATE